MNAYVCEKVNGIIREYKLSESFIEKYLNKPGWRSTTEIYITLGWDYVSKYQILSERFIESHIDEVNWYMIFKHQKLSEEFIEKYAHKVYWLSISKSQKLSEEFKLKYKEKLI